MLNVTASPDSDAEDDDDGDADEEKPFYGPELPPVIYPTSTALPETWKASYRTDNPECPRRERIMQKLFRHMNGLAGAKLPAGRRSAPKRDPPHDETMRARKREIENCRTES